MTKVGQIFAYDEDADDLLTFTLARNEELPFLISSKGETTVRSASIYTDGPLDFEQHSRFSLVAFVSDGKGSDASVALSVNVEDVNDVSIAALKVNTEDGKLSSAGGDFVTIFGENFGHVCNHCVWKAGQPILSSLSSTRDGIFLPTEFKPNPFAFGNGQFTIDMWVRPTENAATTKDQWIAGTQGALSASLLLWYRKTLRLRGIVRPEEPHQ